MSGPVSLLTRISSPGLFCFRQKHGPERSCQRCGVREVGDIFPMDRTATRRRGRARQESLLTKAVNAVFSFVRLAEFEILFFVFLFVAFLIFKDLTSRPAYNQILVEKPGEDVFSLFG